MIKNSQDDNSGVLESSRSPAEALRQQLADILRNGKYGYSDYATAEKLMERVTAYAATVEREGRLEELNDIPHIPLFLYSIRHDNQKLADAMEMSKIASLYVLKRLDELVRLAALQGPREGKE